MSELIWKLLDLLLAFAGGLKRARVEIHEAALLSSGQRCYFIGVTNTSPTREIQVTHVWLALLQEIHIFNEARLFSDD